MKFNFIRYIRWINNNYKNLEIKINKCIWYNCYNSKIVENIIENSICIVWNLDYATNFTANIVQKNIVNKIHRKYVSFNKV